MESWQGKSQSILVSLPPLGITVWKLKEHPSFNGKDNGNGSDEKKKRTPKPKSNGK
ncbi:hypothetical protein D3C78_1862150 [compost metagenome]